MFPTLTTPLGALSFQVGSEGQLLNPKQEFTSPGLGGLTHYEYGPVRVDFSVDALPCASVDARFVATWRVWAIRQAPAVHLLARWEPGAKNHDGGLTCGEHLTALTWYDSGIQLSLGTRDEEALPEAFGDERYWPRPLNEREGLQILVPPQPSGSMLEVQFLIAWKSGEAEDSPMSTALAVDATLYEG